MRLQNKVLLSLGIIWVLFLITVYMGAHHYLLSSLLYLESEGNQEVVINQYAYTRIIDYYVMLFVCLSVFVVALIGYLLRIIFTNNDNALQNMHHMLAKEAKMAEGLNQKISLLEKRAEKSDRADGVFHAVCDHLNSIVASLALVKEKSGHAKMSVDEIKSLENEIASLNDNVNQINHIIKSFQT